MCACAVCEGKKDLLSREFPYAVFDSIVDDIKWSVYIDRGYLRLADKEDGDCLDHGEKFKIIFCPICGRDLTEEVLT